MLDPRKLSHSLLSAELLEAMTRSVLVITASLESDTFIKRQRSELLKLADELGLTFQRIFTDEFTATLEMLDDQRDDMIVALRGFLVAMIRMRSLDKTKADQAAIVKQYVDNLDARVTDLGYHEESAEIRALLVILETINGAVEESGALVIITALGKAQSQFDVVYNQRKTTNPSAADVRLTSVIRREIVDRLNPLISYLDRSAKDDSVRYGTVAANLGKLVVEVMEKAKIAKAAAEAAKEAAAAKKADQPAS